MSRFPASEDAMHSVDTDPSDPEPIADGAVADPGADLLSVRAWARSRGYPIDECACVPPGVLLAYRLVHAG